MEYVVSESNIEKRKAFYNYIIEHSDIKDLIYDDKEIENGFPFVIDFDKNIFYICNSIICCSCAAQNHKIIDIDTFKSKVNLWYNKKRGAIWKMKII